MNTLVLAPFSEAGLDALRRFGTVVYEPWLDTRLLYDPDELGLRLERERFGALIVEADFLFTELFEAAPSLEFAAVCRGALDHVDLAAATEHGVVIVHTPGRNSRAVAELVVGLLLGLARSIPQAHAYVAEGRWEDPVDPYRRFRGRELAGSTLGIIGLGQIGRQVARLARRLGMSVQAHDPYVRPGSRAAAGVTMTSLEALLAGSDFVSVHVPDTPDTEGLLSAERLALLRPGAYLVSVASAHVIDREALATSLREGRLAGAALDVHEAHPIPPTSPLLGLPNVVLTPHIGGATTETVERHALMVATDLERYLSGLRPRHWANPGAGLARRRTRARDR